MITVIPFLQSADRLIERQPFPLAQALYFRRKHLQQFSAGDATKRIIRPIHADVIQLIQVAEHTDLGKFGDTGQEHKAKVTVGTLQHTVESLQRATVLIHKRFIQKRLKQRFVIFIYQHDNLLAGKFVRSFYHVCKTLFGTAVTTLCSVFLLPLLQMLVEHGKQIGCRLILPGVQVQMKHGIFHPFRLQLLNGKPTEQIFPSLKIGFESGKKQTLAETARTAQEIRHRSRSELINHLCLIHIKITILTQFLKSLHTNRQFTHHIHPISFFRSSMQIYVFISRIREECYFLCRFTS